ncbi:MAG: KUP/HAK/KT family potassium transporter [Caulobacteraceae bacterium]|nr:KUP/HAK/KT family potassium transporter [Caulobacteraceae bacterium]
MANSTIGEPRRPAVALGALAALGIVYGDLGTSPLYTMQTAIAAIGPHIPRTDAAMGVLSLIFWTLLITISVKYCLFVMRADNHGEGGILALMSLVGMNHWSRATFIGASMGLLGAALIYGDGVITPAISVLSALEGVKVSAPSLTPYVLPLALIILVTLFAAQRFGTARIGSAFGPTMLVWFVAMGALGLSGIFRHPGVLLAVNPLYGMHLLVVSAPTAALVLGGVFLCATGGEALYADMGHIGRLPIQVAWYAIVLPSCLLSYAGQTALLLDGAAKGANPFFLLAPGWAAAPLVILATLATIIASQAIITGSFSMTRQAMQLGWLPGFKIRQTSDSIYGQIYVPAVNLMMAVGTTAITLSFRSSDRLASAFGTAVSTTMVLTTLLLFRAMHKVWRCPLWIVVPLGGLFLLVDTTFFAANLVKIVDGGWIPLTLGVTIFAIMITWRTGVQAVRAKLKILSETPDTFAQSLLDRKVARVPGTAVFLTRTTEQVPGLIVDYVSNIGSLHINTIALNVQFQETPRVTEADRGSVARLAEGLYRVTLRYGFIEIPDLSADLAAVRGLPAPIKVEETVFFATRDLVVPCSRSPLVRWRMAFFAFLYRNAVRPTDRFNLPAARTMEIARPIEL